MPTLYQIMEKYEDSQNLNRTEGRTGVENLCRLVRALGYENDNFGQFDHNGSFGDLIEFLEDNSGAIEAIKQWICNTNLPEWKQALTINPEDEVLDDDDWM